MGYKRPFKLFGLRDGFIRVDRSVNNISARGAALIDAVVSHSATVSVRSSVVNQEREISAAVGPNMVIGIDFWRRIALAGAIIGVVAVVIEQNAHTGLSAVAAGTAANGSVFVVPLEVNENSKRRVPAKTVVHNCGMVRIVSKIVKQIPDSVMASKSVA